MMEINDELMMPCAQCCRKHLSAAIAYHCTGGIVPIETGTPARVLVARAYINYVECLSGYRSHASFAIGLLVMAEEDAMSTDPCFARACRELRLRVTDGDMSVGTEFKSLVSSSDMYMAHLDEAYREFPDIRIAVDREPFYRDNMSEPELRQAEINFHLAQIKWLDENIFGIKPVEKGEDQMACKKKQAAAKGGEAMEPAKKAAAKGGKSTKGGCKGGCKK